jgi:hypothetical protein
MTKGTEKETTTEGSHSRGMATADRPQLRLKWLLSVRTPCQNRPVLTWACHRRMGMKADRVLWWWWSVRRPHSALGSRERQQRKEFRLTGADRRGRGKPPPHKETANRKRGRGKEFRQGLRKRTQEVAPLAGQKAEPMEEEEETAPQQSHQVMAKTEVVKEGRGAQEVVGEGGQLATAGSTVEDERPGRTRSWQTTPGMREGKDWGKETEKGRRATDWKEPMEREGEEEGDDH